MPTSDGQIFNSLQPMPKVETYFTTSKKVFYNTVYFLFKYTTSLKESIPALFQPDPVSTLKEITGFLKNPHHLEASSSDIKESRNQAYSTTKILKSVSYIATRQLFPLILLNYCSNTVLRWTNPENESLVEDALLSTTISYAGWLINTAVSAYTWRQGFEIAAELLIVETFAPAAFNQYKNRNSIPQSLASKEQQLANEPCAVSNCSIPRRAKGSAREFFVILFNDLLTYGIKKTPYVGDYAGILFSICFSGTLIVRAALSTERCERHRSTHTELVLALGLINTISNSLLDKVVQSTIGTPHYIINRTLKQFLLLWHINNAAHIKIDYVPMGEGLIKYDPITFYETATGIVTDVVFEGMHIKIPKLLKPKPDQEPLISASKVLQILTKACKEDIQSLSEPENPSWVKKTLPSIFRNSKGALENPVVALFWKDYTSIMYEIFYELEKKNTFIKNTHIPPRLIINILPIVLLRQYDVPVKLSEFLLDICLQEDFKKFSKAFLEWIVHHQPSNFVLSKTDLSQPSINFETEPENKFVICSSPETQIDNSEPQRELEKDPSSNSDYTKIFINAVKPRHSKTNELLLFAKQNNIFFYRKSQNVPLGDPFLLPEMKDTSFNF